MTRVGRMCGAAQARSPGGYTLLTCQVASHGVSQAVYEKLPYDHIKHFAPISLPVVAAPTAEVPAPKVGLGCTAIAAERRATEP